MKLEFFFFPEILLVFLFLRDASEMKVIVYNLTPDSSFIERNRVESIFCGNGLKYLHNS